MDDERTKPATKGDILDLEIKFDSKLVQLKDEFLASQANLKDEFLASQAQLKDELVEAIRDSQTEVLRAFYGFSQTVQERFKEQDQTEASLKRRMSTIESRIFEIEKRLNMPPSGI